MLIYQRVIDNVCVYMCVCVGAIYTRGGGGRVLAGVMNGVEISFVFHLANETSCYYLHFVRQLTDLFRALFLSFFLLFFHRARKVNTFQRISREILKPWNSPRPFRR